MQPSPEALNLDQALRILRRRAALIVLCMVVVAGAAFAFSKHETRKYTATASLAFSYNSLAQQIAGLQGISGNVLAQQASNLELVRLGDMSARTAAALGHGLTDEKVAAALSVAAQGESSIVNVSATNASPALAAAIANTYVRLFVDEQQRANHQYLASALAIVSRELARLSPQQRLGEDGLNLQNRAQTLRLLAGLKYGSIQVAQQALPPTVPSSPNTSRNTELGVFLGLLIGVGLALLLEHLDSRVKSAEDLEEIYRLPLLGVVPQSAALARAPGEGRGEVLAPGEAEAFNLIRAHLRFFSAHQELCTIVVASASPADGKTTIARNLAEAAVRLGSRTLIVDVDLRQPTLAAQFGLPAAPGLGDVLMGSLGMAEATRSIDLRATAGRASATRTLDVLVSGSMRLNPGELIEGRAMSAVLERARAAYDLVIIDTPPLTAVSDALPLLSKVDGVVIVGWVGRSPRDAAQRLRRVLDGTGIPLVGVIANGVKSGVPSPYASVGEVSPPNGALMNGAAVPTPDPAVRA